MAPAAQHKSLLASTRLRPSGGALIQAAVAEMVGAVRPGGAEKALRDYGQNVALIHRAATSAATLSSSEWAGVLGSNSVADFVGGLGPTSAAASLIRLGLELDLGRSASIRVPAVVNGASGAAFVAEGQPIPVSSFLFGSAELTPFKLATIVAFTAETAKSTAFEVIARQVISEAAGLGLDAAMLGTAAATDEAPAGLRSGATSLSATAGGGEDAMIADLVNLAEAVSGVAGVNIALVAAPAESLKLALRFPEMRFPMFSSAALPSGSVVAVAVNALVSAVDALPDIEVSRHAVVHMDDTPTHISTPGDPDNVVAAPAQSLYQTDAIALRLILGASWALRAPAASSLAVVEDVTW